MVRPGEHRQDATISIAGGRWIHQRPLIPFVALPPPRSSRH